jgi:hypothetical protein
MSVSGDFSANYAPLFAYEKRPPVDNRVGMTGEKKALQIN